MPLPIGLRVRIVNTMEADNETGLCYRCRPGSLRSIGQPQKIKWPGNLQELVAESSLRSVARLLGVSDKVVAKRLAKSDARES